VTEKICATATAVSQLRTRWYLL